MTPPPNALRCPCGRGWLRENPDDEGMYRCDHTGWFPDVCVIILSRRRARRGIGRCAGGNERAVDLLRLVRTWPYATTTTQETP